MSARRLKMHRVEKPWGRRALWGCFDDQAGDQAPVGEIWFQDDDDPQAELLVKYLFTSEPLSIQVHPDDSAARLSGYPRGKDEAWVVLDAAAESAIAIGTKNPVARASLRAAAMDGSITAMMDWRPVRAGDVFYSPAGTVHAIGADITLVEIQQNVDLTYRLYDYGRPRELHLDAGIAASDAKPFLPNFVPEQVEPGRHILCEGPKFVLERWAGATDRSLTLPDAVPGWFVPLSGQGHVDGERWIAGEVWRADGQVTFDFVQPSDALLAYPLTRRL